MILVIIIIYIIEFNVNHNVDLAILKIFDTNEIHMHRFNGEFFCMVFLQSYQV